MSTATELSSLEAPSQQNLHFYTNFLPDLAIALHANTKTARQ